MAADVLFTVEKECPVCVKTTLVTKVRSRLQMVKQDSDFCTYYKEINPNYYSVWVCPHCGYASQDTFFNELAGDALVKVKTFLSGKKVNVSFQGIRTREQAIDTYKLAIFYAELISTLPSRLAGLYLKLAWLFREAGQQEEEQLLLSKARDYYEQATVKERFPIGGMTEITAEYLIGELYRRTGKLDLAISFLGKVVNNPQAKLERRIFEMAKEAWHQAREQKKANTTS